MTNRLEPGELAPDFSLPDHTRHAVSSDSLEGRYVLYFYPADDTPGCTKEACQFNDLHFGDICVFGVSPDGADSHRAFRDKYGLQFTLLTDEDHLVAKRYGAYGTKNLYGREYEGIIRSTFVISDGRIEHAWYNVKADGHAARVRSAITG